MFSSKPALWLYGMLLVAGALCQSALADTVVLKNGKKFQGIVKHESPSQVTIHIGLGTVSFNRDQIASVERSENQAVEKGWKTDYILRGKFIPKGLEDLAARYTTLESSRHAAVLAKVDNERLQSSRVQLFREIHAIQDQVAEIAEQFQGLVPGNDVPKYNSLVTRQNSLLSRSIVIKNDLDKDDRQASANRKNISNYVDQLNKFKEELALRKKAIDENPGTERRAYEFFKIVTPRIDQFAKEFKQVEVPHRGDKNHMLVSVRVNDRVNGVFLLDTGATYVTLSGKMASDLGLDLSAKKDVKVSLANGSSVSAQPVLLESMQAGDARVAGVVAMVFPESPHAGVDGLLGMSFLREFTIQLDPVNKKLVFQKFAPK